MAPPGPCPDVTLGSCVSPFVIIPFLLIFGFDKGTKKTKKGKRVLLRNLELKTSFGLRLGLRGPNLETPKTAQVTIIPPTSHLFKV